MIVSCKNVTLSQNNVVLSPFFFFGSMAAIGFRSQVVHGNRCPVTQALKPSLPLVETLGATEVQYGRRPHFHNAARHHHSRHAGQPVVRRPEARAGDRRHQDGPGLQTQLSSLLPARQKLPPVVCVLGQAGANQPKQQQLR